MSAATGEVVDLPGLDDEPTTVPIRVAPTWDAIKVPCPARPRTRGRHRRPPRYAHLMAAIALVAARRRRATP